MRRYRDGSETIIEGGSNDAYYTPDPFCVSIGTSLSPFSYCLTVFMSSFFWRWS